MKAKASERGVALLVTLLLVAAMSVLAVVVLEDVRFAVRRSANIRVQTQAQWYALGAEAVARARLGAVLAQNPGYVTLDGGWSGTPLDYRVDNSLIRVRVDDRGACFNLNSVVSGEPENYAINPVGADEFKALLVTLTTPEIEAQQLTEALVDWMDSDGARLPMGAEDETYQQGRAAYRTSGALLSEESELRAIRGFSAEVYERIRPYVCALPYPLLTEVNINTVSSAGAPVLSAIFLGRLPVEAARQVIERRPLGGWMSQTAFLEDPVLKTSIDGGGAAPIQQLTVRSRFFLLDGMVEIGDSDMVYSALLEAHPSGQLITVGRRWSAPE